MKVRELIGRLMAESASLDGEVFLQGVNENREIVDVANDVDEDGKVQTILKFDNDQQS